MAVLVPGGSVHFLHESNLADLANARRIGGSYDQVVTNISITRHQKAPRLANSTRSSDFTSTTGKRYAYLASKPQAHSQGDVHGSGPRALDFLRHDAIIVTGLTCRGARVPIVAARACLVATPSMSLVSCPSRIVT